MPALRSDLVQRSLKNVVESAMAMGGTMPPTMTEAMMTWPVVPRPELGSSAAVPKTYAALLKGPPMSMDIMPPSTRPSTTMLPVPRPLRKPLRPVLMSANSGLSASITMPMASTPSTG